MKVVNEQVEKQTELISLVELSAKSGIKKIKPSVISKGFKPFQLEEGSNKKYFLTKKDGEEYIRMVKEEKDNKPKNNATDIASKTSGIYCIEVPSFDGTTRIKIGWSTDIKERINDYRTIVPDLRVRATFCTHLRWCENLALRLAECHGRKIHTELFEIVDYDDYISELFEILEKLEINEVKI